MRQPLPVDEILPVLLDALSSRGAAVLRAPTGAGKTTRVPPALLAVARKVVVLEPRRVAARAAARRMAAEGGWRLGEEVGWAVRFDRRAGPRTRILVVTEGLLVRMLQGDPFLEGVDAVVLDELHERSLHADLALAMVHRVRSEARPDLRVVAMSATLDAGPVAAYLDAPLVESEGRQHPVEIEHAPWPDERPVHLRAADGVRAALGRVGGDVLCFLPGAGEIHRTAAALGDLHGVDVRPLYGDLPGEQQDAALGAGPRRRVVLATNVAETSVTVEGVEAVVDTGVAKVLRRHRGTGLDRLVLEPISRASADQRAGRAGRQGPGLCLRLWTALDHARRPAHAEAEIHRVDLAGPALQLLAWGEPDLRAFPWLEAPADAALDDALALLERLDLARGGAITARGAAAAALPVHPRLGRLLLEGAARGHLAEAAWAAALLSERNPLPRPRGEAPRTECDLTEEIGRARRDLPAHAHLRRVAADLERHARRPGVETGAPGPLRRSLLAAWPDRVARLGSERTGAMVGGRGVRLARESGVRAPLALCVDLDDRPAHALVRRAAAVEREWLDLERRVVVRWAGERERVEAVEQTALEDLVLDERSAPLPADGSVEALLVEVASADPEVALGTSSEPLAPWLLRLRFASAHAPDLPAPDVAWLRARIADLAPGCRGLADLRRAARDLPGWLDHRQRALLEALAPERLEVPSGSRIRLQYRDEGPPILAVRFAELFGLAETPTVAAGQVPVLLHLLAPNGRPQQITQDLAGFWERTWPEVRKELRARYPKHPWPQDPLSAQPMRGARRRRR